MKTIKSQSDRVDDLPASTQVLAMGAFLLVGEMAALLRISSGAVRLAIKAGRIKAVRLGRDWRIPREEALRVVTGAAC